MSKPPLRERLKPFELVAIAAVLAVFAGLVAFGGTREPQLALILAGVAFIVALLVLAMLALAASSDEDDDDEGGTLLDRNDRKR